jgi:hypothetical protein
MRDGTGAVHLSTDAISESLTVVVLPKIGLYNKFESVTIMARRISIKAAPVR